MKIVLASQSPRRRELLGKMGLEFTARSPEIDEEAITGLPAEELVKALSRKKALHIARDEAPDAIVIGSDTVVVLDGEILGKPDSEEQAVTMLTALSGRSHEVCTGITVCQGDRVDSQAEVTKVTFRSLTQEEIRQYVATGEPMDKAGSYGIQSYGALLVEGIQGDYSSVVGLPVCRLGRMLLNFGVNCMELAGKERH